MAALDYMLTNHPGLLRELLEDPGEVLERLEASEDELRCPEEVHEAYARGERATEAVTALGDIPLTEALPRILHIAERYLGEGMLIHKEPYGLRFLESAPESASMDWTATATFECVFSPGCHADVDG